MPAMSDPFNEFVNRVGKHDGEFITRDEAMELADLCGTLADKVEELRQAMAESLQDAATRLAEMP